MTRDQAKVIGEAVIAVEKAGHGEVLVKIHDHEITDVWKTEKIRLSKE